MNQPAHREWMYNRVLPNRAGLSDAFYVGVETFISHACGLDQFLKTRTIRCPCVKCDCRKMQTADEVRVHLYRKGFRPNYFYWTSHGEEFPQPTPVTVQQQSIPNLDQEQTVYEENFNSYESMVMDAAGPSLAQCYQESRDETPNKETQDFYDLLAATESPLFEGCSSHSELSASLQLLTIKAEHNISQEAFNKIVQFCRETWPSDNRMPPNYYRTKKLVERCGENRYILKKSSYGKVNEVARNRMWYLPLAPRLQRLYSSPATASHMRWHFDNVREEGVLVHPSDGEAWKDFDKTHKDFAKEPQNVRLGLCADGFSPFNIKGKPYSCWPVIVTPYNLPPSMCMKEEYLFLTIIIPGPKPPHKGKIDVFLQPLINELKMLWEVGVTTYDVSLKQNFQMRAALMWTVNDFPAYAMLSAWSTAGSLEDYLVLIVWNTPKPNGLSMVRRYHFLIVTDAFCRRIIHIEGTRTILLKISKNLICP
ncbi:uncharacterized protein LOC130711967 [Lotus japonicus]|uniref:uncharacterized protein LOC130711967 n=1 Tax=Lotus japonicus TaxID=34305 RepID=UPI002585A0F0|nr:uncharacterized protein LOC130711967 [Lotus japonicus]